MASILVDEGISRALVADAVAQGMTAIHAIDIGLKSQHDSLVFLEAQRRGLTMLTLNRDDFIFCATSWRNWGHGDHFGIVAPKEGPQPTKNELLRVLLRVCADTSTWLNRIELF